MDSNFDQAPTAARRIGGMLSDFSMAAMDRLFGSYCGLGKGCRFIPAGSSRTYRATLRELMVGDDLIGEGGLVVLDEFTILNHSQILAATFKHLATARTKLSIVRVTDEEASLCKAKDLGLYARFVLGRILPEMAMRGVPMPAWHEPPSTRTIGPSICAVSSRRNPKRTTAARSTAKPFRIQKALAQSRFGRAW